MEILKYILKINTKEIFYENVSTIVRLQPENYKYGWSYEMLFEEQKDCPDIISIFLDSLEGKYNELNTLGVKNSDINIWLIYGYNYQCNMEFEPRVLERLGKNGIKLCISCFEAGE